MLIKFEIEKFREYVKGKKDKIRNTKTIVERLIKEDKEMEDVYLDEISKELEKREIEEEEKIRENEKKKLSELSMRIEENEKSEKI